MYVMYVCLCVCIYIVCACVPLCMFVYVYVYFSSADCIPVGATLQCRYVIFCVLRFCVHMYVNLYVDRMETHQQYTHAHPHQETGVLFHSRQAVSSDGAQ
jgi:hypothetical protein